jgi:tRNA G46 methylase TrmB
MVADAMMGNSKPIVTNQTGIHEQLCTVVSKHLARPFLKPIHPRSQACFDELTEHVKRFGGDIIIDSCCGVGQSTRILAKQHPNALVIGIDKSQHRLSRQINDVWQVSNYLLVRADLNDLYRLIAASDWPVSQHYLLYPNPWPKSKHLQRRWHGAAVFPAILAIGQQLTLRSNWRLYLEEFQTAAALAGKASTLVEIPLQAQPMTPFEAKFQASGQRCWQLHFDQL